MPTSWLGRKSGLVSGTGVLAQLVPTAYQDCHVYVPPEQFIAMRPVSLMSLKDIFGSKIVTMQSDGNAAYYE